MYKYQKEKKCVYMKEQHDESKLPIELISEDSRILTAIQNTSTLQEYKRYNKMKTKCTNQHIIYIFLITESNKRVKKPR